MASDRTTVLQDGAVAGLIGAVTVMLVFLVHDAFTGHPLQTPSVLATATFQGAEAAKGVEPSLPTALSWDTHVLIWVAVGMLASLLFMITDRAPRSWYLVFVGVVFALFALLYLDGALGVPGLGRFHLWTGALLGLLAMGLYLWRRHPGIFRRADHAYDDL